MRSDELWEAGALVTLGNAKPDLRSCGLFRDTEKAGATRGNAAERATGIEPA